MLYGVWKVQPSNNEETFIKPFYVPSSALMYAEALAEDRKAAMPAGYPLTTNTKIKSDGSAAVYCKTPSGAVNVMFVVRHLNVDDEPETSIKTNTGTAFNALAQVDVMYESYLDLRKRLVTAMKDSATVRDLVSEAPGPKPGGKSKSAQTLIDKPQDLTPGRIQAILEYLDGRVDI